jgi:hypothetical protein
LAGAAGAAFFRQLCREEIYHSTATGGVTERSLVRHAEPPRAFFKASLSYDQLMCSYLVIVSVPGGLNQKPSRMSATLTNFFNTTDSTRLRVADAGWLDASFRRPRPDAAGLSTR